jgi:hypothetical protein
MGGQWDQILLFLAMSGQLWAATDLRLGLDARLLDDIKGRDRNSYLGLLAGIVNSWVLFHSRK